MAADQNRTGRDRVRVLSRAVTVTGTACWTLLAVAGCGADGPSNTVAPHDAQIGYFPTAVGIQWVYDQPVPDFGVVTLTQEISAAELV